MNDTERRAQFYRLLSEYKRGKFTTEKFYERVHDLFWENIPPISELMELDL